MEDGFPRYTYDLLKQLNLEIEKPQFPNTIHGVSAMDEAALRRGIWFAAQRALVDGLIDQLIEWERRNDEEFDSEELRPSGFGPRVLPADQHVRETSVGGVEGLESGPLVPVHRFTD